MAAELTVIRWRDIPMQVVARSGKASARRLLSDRFQEAVDASAMVAGLIASDDYTAEMTMDRRACGEDLDGEVRREADRIEDDWTESVLKDTIRAAGYRRKEPA